MSEWEIPKEKIIAVISDNGANITKAVKDSFGTYKYVPCFAHTINLVVEKSITNTTLLTDLLSNVREIVKHFKRSTFLSDELRKKQINQGILIYYRKFGSKQNIFKINLTRCMFFFVYLGIKEGAVKKLTLDVSTRWNSIFYMLQRFVELSKIILDIMLTRPNGPEMISARQLQEVHDIIVVLRPLEMVTTEMSAENYVTISKVLPIVSCLTNGVSSQQPMTDLGESFKVAIIAQLQRRFGNIEMFNLCPVATLLDPRFKNLHFKDLVACTNAIKHLKQIVSNNRMPLSSSSSEEDTNESAKVFNLWEYHQGLAHKRSSSRASNSKISNTNSPSDQLVMNYFSTPVTPLKQNPLET